MKKTVILRVDGGKVWGISIGHLKRCLILAARLADQFNVLLVMKDYPDGVSYARAQGCKVHAIAPDDDSDDTLIRLCERYAAQKVIIDLKQTPYESFFHYARSASIQTIVFDILGECAGQPDVVINDSFVPQFTQYPRLNDATTRTCVGPAYFILGSVPDVEPISKTVSKVLLTMGGSDPAGLTAKIIGSLLPELAQYALDVVLGPAFTEHEEVKSSIGNHHYVRIHVDPSQFLSLLSQSDVIITAAGRTLYECAYLGRPTIVVASIEHEAITSAEYARRTGSFDVGLWQDGRTPGMIRNALERYARSYELRARVSFASRRLVDGNGLTRVLELIYA